MTGRERILNTLEFKGTDRIPMDVWVLPAARMEHGERLTALQERYTNRVDIASIVGPFDHGFTPAYYQPGEFTDPWGSVWRNLQPGVIGEVKKPVFADYAAMEGYQPPIEQFRREWEANKEGVAAQIAQARAAGKFVIGGWISVFERMQFLRGTEELYCDIALEEEELDRMTEIIMDFMRVYVDAWAEMDVDAIPFGDDWGTQISLLISPAVWVKRFKPLYQELIDKIHAAGKKVFFHSDGYIFDLYPHFIEMGVDAINSQLWCMGVEKVAEQFAGKITFWGEISRQDTLPNGTPEDVKAAKNIEVERFPLYEHKIDPVVMEAITGERFADLYGGDDRDLDEFFRHYCKFYRDMGYDTVSFEELIGPAMPGSGALGEHVKGVIQTREDFERYPWDGICDTYFEMYHRSFEALRRNLPEGMKAIGGVGYGIFECVQDLVGYEDLCYIRADDEDLYRDLFFKIGWSNLRIWQRFLKECGDIYCVCRFGDDLGFKSATLLPPEDIRELVIPQYKPIIQAVHDAGKPFLLHSCGCIFSVMDDLIAAGIDAKHSNEDQIAPFPYWVETYGDRIGNFGGIDTDAVCRLDAAAMYDYIDEVVGKSRGHGGFAFGSGNSIPDYVPPEGYRAMNDAARRIRGDFGQ